MCCDDESPLISGFCSFISADLLSIPEDDSLSSSDSDDKSEKEERKSLTKRRKRGLRRYEKKDAQGNWIIPHIPLPRIPKQDIRRNYGQMVVNVFNSGSRQLMGEFLHQMMNEHGRYTLHWNGTFCHSLLVLHAPRLLQRLIIMHMHVLEFSWIVGHHFQLARGRDMLADYWYESMLESPDMTFRFEPKQIKVRSDGTSVLSGIYRFGGTLILSSEDQKRRKADWSYMSNSFRLNGNEIVPINSTTANSSDTEATASPDQAVSADEQAKTSRRAHEVHHLSQTLIASEPTCASESDAVAMANAFLRQHILEPSARSGGNTPIMIDYKTEGIFSLQIDANYRLDGVDTTLDRYYLNHQLAPWLQGPNAFTEFAQSFF